MADKIRYTLDNFIKEDIPIHCPKGLYKREEDVIFSIYQGSLFYASYISRMFDIHHNIIKFQRYDGDDSVATVHTLNNFSSFKRLILIDDIIDEGDTMIKCLETICDKYNILEERYNMIKVIAIFGKEGGLEKVRSRFPGIEIEVWRKGDDDVWVDFFTEPES